MEAGAPSSTRLDRHEPAAPGRLEQAMHPIHPAAPSALALSLGALALALLAGCDRYDRLDRPLPKFTATTLDGRTIDSDSLAGKPWIINLWVPG
jgi:cytochrome oxidase Cu insertion factor (SCO1/SenC/PrrC family)